MALADAATIQLVRFGHVHSPGRIDVPPSPDALFFAVGADARAAGTDPAAIEAYVFLALGLHPSLEAARRFSGTTRTLLPWMDDAVESWTAVLRPFRHHGTANYLDRDGGGPLFEAMAAPPEPDEPIVVVTSIGWREPGRDMERVGAVGGGVQAIRSSMTAVAGLHTQQTFFLSGGLEWDAPTVTTWRSLDAMRAWAYAPGVHRSYLERHRAQPMADRTSFTRYRIVQSGGSWYGDALTPNVEA